MKKLPILAAAVTALVLAGGLLLTLEKNLEVAPALGALGGGVVAVFRLPRRRTS